VLFSMSLLLVSLVLFSWFLFNLHVEVNTLSQHELAQNDSQHYPAFNLRQSVIRQLVEGVVYRLGCRVHLQLQVWCFSSARTLRFQFTFPRLSAAAGA